MMGIGFSELAVILVIIMIIFGAGKLPEIGSAFGKSIRNFKQSMKEAEAADAEQPAAEGAKTPEGAQTATAKAADKKEEDIIDELARELDKNRIDTIKTRHDGLVQDRDVFTESVKRVPFGMKSSDRGVSRDIF
ncbi:MAG: twin-arginine translocase TatA/TatE family subunit [Nitrospinae bacterium]|nr:twin-arginine translocase TatA/TatE family subunit [Nitrospinota bacterium]